MLLSQFNLQSFLSEDQKQKINEISRNHLKEENFQRVNEKVLRHVTVGIPEKEKEESLMKVRHDLLLVLTIKPMRKDN